ncbi:MAG: NAD(P)-binding domain-containing protein [Nocardioidaceae bacterium]|nr:NAD(P)-binding domain-containing protein [Nocardioidaceae bacterium]MCL2615159.1 NAD(P)-binding domain-containing protein [Nocardioidaceae bacterium]
MTTIGFIGSGNIGSTVARLAVRAGYDVVMSNSRGPETLADLVAELGEHARAATAEEAAAAGDLAVATVPLKSLHDIPVDALRGKVVIDTINYYPQRDGQVAELDRESTTTSELVQRHLPGSKVVKCFNNIYFEFIERLARPIDDPDRSVLPIAGDDTEAKDEVTRVLDAIGFAAYDVGPLSEGWRFQRDTAAYAGLYVAEGETGWPPRNARRVDVPLLQERLAAAKRYKDM